MSALAMQPASFPSRRQSCWLGTPEIYFRKNIDNSRLVKVDDRTRVRRRCDRRVAGSTQHLFEQDDIHIQIVDDENPGLENVSRADHHLPTWICESD